MIVRMGCVDFDVSPGLPVDALTTALLLQPPPPPGSSSSDAAAASAASAAPLPSSAGNDGRFFFPAWPPPATPDNPARGAIPLGRVTARATLVPSLDAALPEAVADLLPRRKEKKGGPSSCSSFSSSSSSSEGDSDASDSDRERRRKRKGMRSPWDFPRRARGCKLPEELDREWEEARAAREAAAAAAAASRGRDEDEGAGALARTPERAAGKKKTADGGCTGAGKRRVVDSDEDNSD